MLLAGEADLGLSLKLRDLQVRPDIAVNATARVLGSCHLL